MIFRRQAQPQQQQRTLLVTPQGEILDYVPERGSVTVRVDTEGRNVLIDQYGNVVATEVPARSYFPRAQPQNDYSMDQPQRVPPGVDPGYGQDSGYASTNADFGDGVVTGTVPADPQIDRQPLDEPSMLPEPDSQYSDQGQEMQPMTKTAQPEIPVGKLSRNEITALQVFLDREGVSPGVIDGKMGQNVNKAIVSWEKISGETLDPNNSDDIIQRLRLSGGMAFTTYTISAGDAAGPYVASIPEDYAEKAQLPSLAYTSQTEMLAEKFHMDEGYLKELNPGVDFTVPGTNIKVVDPGPAKSGQVAKIIADKGLKQVRAYDESGNLVAAYPASIGSSDTPSPSGTVTVDRVAFNPGYTYNPKVNFKQGGNDKVLAIPPGPNGPVGTVWMALSKPTYGIHGTPEPSLIGRTQSHGCVRLTNWDATELAKMVKPGVTVEFTE
nr:L,D-transpeptidase [Rhizobium halophytocola]